MSDMRHMEYLRAVALGDVAVLEKKEATYQGSWKKAGGRSAWFMARRNLDRLLNMMARPETPPEFSLQDVDAHFMMAQGEGAQGPGDDITLDYAAARHLREVYLSEDIFASIAANPSGADGTVLAVLRDARRYFTLVEAEMVARGVVEPEEAPAAAVPEPRTATEDEAEVMRWGLQRLLGWGGGNPIDTPDLYDFCSVLLSHDRGRAVSRDEAKETVLGLLYSADPLESKYKTLNPGLVDPEKLKPYATATQEEPPQRSIPRFTQTEQDTVHLNSDPETKPATPEDGGQHASLVPWAVSMAWRYRKGFQPGWSHTVEFDRWWKQQTAGIWVLEPAVKDELPPPIIAHLYIGGANGWRYLDIARCPADARDWFPRLRREVNSTEHEQLPEWQRPMYRWNETGTKWVLEGSRVTAWARED